jgi:ribonuclease HI
MKLLLHIDGGSRGNPGPSGGGVVLADEHGRPLLEAGYFFGIKTNNQAEYSALLRGLDAAAERGATEVAIYSDSELLVRQLNGDYRVKSPQIAPLFAQARTRLEGFRRWKAEHVMREQNGRADELANLAMDARRDVVEVSGSNGSVPAKPPASPKSRRVRVVCTRAPARGACPADCKQGHACVIDATLPAGLCIEPAEAVVKAVRAIRGGAPAARIVNCPRAGCGAQFSVRPE